LSVRFCWLNPENGSDPIGIEVITGKAKRRERHGPREPLSRSRHRYCRLENRVRLSPSRHSIWSFNTMQGPAQLGPCDPESTTHFVWRILRISRTDARHDSGSGEAVSRPPRAKALDPALRGNDGEGSYRQLCCGSGRS